jgi:hypothetical protein
VRATLGTMSFDLTRVRFYEWMLAAFGAALVGVMFVHWYGFGARRVDAWQAFSVTDVVLAVVAAVAIGVAVAGATHRTVALPQALSALATIAGGVATIVVLVRAASPPGDGAVSREVGLWLGLVCAIGIAVCGWRSMSDEHFPGTMRQRLDVERLELPSDKPPATSS